VVQSNAFTDSRISTVLVAVITSNLRLAVAPGNVRLSRANSGLKTASVVNVSQVLTLDRALLTSKIRALPQRPMRDVDEGLRLVLGL